MRIYLDGMEFYAHHGYYDHEKEMGNKFIVDLVIEADLSKPAISDLLSETINYEKIYETIAAEMMKRSNLLEHAACRIADTLKEGFAEINQITVKLRKVNPRLGGIVGNVGVEITR